MYKKETWEDDKNWKYSPLYVGSADQLKNRASLCVYTSSSWNFNRKIRNEPQIQKTYCAQLASPKVQCSIAASSLKHHRHCQCHLWFMIIIIIIIIVLTWVWSIRSFVLRTRITSARIARLASMMAPTWWWWLLQIFCFSELFKGALYLTLELTAFQKYSIYI